LIGGCKRGFEIDQRTTPPQFEGGQANTGMVGIGRAKSQNRGFISALVALLFLDENHVADAPGP
jgi:hypothetical protein